MTTNDYESLYSALIHCDARTVHLTRLRLASATAAAAATTTTTATTCINKHDKTTRWRTWLRGAVSTTSSACSTSGIPSTTSALTRERCETLLYPRKEACCVVFGFCAAADARALGVCGGAGVGVRIGRPARRCGHHDDERG
jgi:hypothetical protein